MGWASGSGIMSDVMSALKAAGVSDYQRYLVYKPMIKSLWSEDWDTTDECIGRDPAFDRALFELDADYFEDGDEPTKILAAT